MENDFLINRLKGEVDYAERKVIHIKARIGDLKEALASAEQELKQARRDVAEYVA